MAWLNDNPPIRSQFRCPRRAPLSGLIVVHTAESVLDTVGPDTGAENVARFIQRRHTAGSYHDLVDSDSTINLVDWRCEAYQDGTGSNAHALSISFALSYLDWPRMTSDRVDAFIDRGVISAVAMARFVKAVRNIDIPPRRLTRDESERGLPGFIDHARRDPARRKDPGDPQFPWDMFLTRYARAMSPTPTPPPTPVPPPIEEDEDDMAFFLQASDDPKVWLVEPKRMTHVLSSANGEKLAKSLGIPYAPAVVARDQFNLLIKDRDRYPA